ncbi:MAG: hypothetical protein ABR582_01865 [Gemmatimonadaceae bacterium]
MSWFFPGRARLRDFAEGIGPELRALPTPEPTAELFARIVASRDAGVRVIVPVDPEVSRRSWRIAAILAIAAVLVVAVAPRGARYSAKNSDVPDFVSSSFFGDVAFAQTLRAAAPTLPAASATRASVIRPMSLAYSREIRDGAGKLLARIPLELQITPDVLDNVPVWRVTTISQNMSEAQRYVSSDTVYVNRSDLAVARRSIHVAPYSRYARINVQQVFRRDSVLGRMTTDGPSTGAGRSISRALPKSFQPYVADQLGPVFLMAVPLDRTWRGSVSLLGWAVRPEDLFVPVELRVEGEDSIVVPAGRFDCWRLSIRFSGRRLDYWVRKSDRLAVRVRDNSNVATFGAREIVLTQEGSK